MIMFRLQFFFGMFVMFIFLACSPQLLKAHHNPTVCTSSKILNEIEKTNNYTFCNIINNINFYLNQQTPTILDTLITRDTFAICSGDSLEIFGEWESSPADYQVTYTAEDGMEFTHITTLEVLDTFHTYEHVSLCAGHFIKIGNQIIDTGGTYTLELHAENGCDSMHTMIVTAIDTIFTRDTIAICNGDSLEVNGMFVHQSGDYSSTHVAQSGCDSTHTTYVEVLDVLETHETTTICFGESIVVFGENQVASGIFSAHFIAENGCDSMHTIELIVLDELEAHLEGGFTCMDENNAWVNADVQGGLPPYHYQWNMTTDNSASLQNLSSGVYYLTVTDAQGCMSTTAMQLEFSNFDLFQLDVLEASCFGETDGEITVVPFVSNLQYSLDGVHYQESTNFSDLAAGTYTFYTLDETGCVYEESVEIDEPSEIFLQLPPDTTLRIGQSLLINPVSNARYVERYEWTPTSYLDCLDCPYPTASPIEDTPYELTITDENGCTATDVMTIYVDQSPLIYIPNAFSPNNDGDNDVFMIFTNPAVKNIQTFRLFDRWGEMMHQADNFSPNDPQYGWNGYFKNELMSGGVYAYFAKVELLNGDVLMYKGDVNLVR